MKKTMYRSLIYSLPYIFFSILSITFSTLAMYRSTQIIDYALLGNLEMIKSSLIPLAIFTVLDIPARGLSVYSLARWSKKFNMSLKIKYIETLFNKNIDEFQEESNALYLSNLTNDMNTIETKFFNPIQEIFYNFILLIAGIVVIISIDYRLLLAMLVVIIFIVTFSTIMGKPLQKPESQKSGLLQSYTNYIKEVLSAFSIIKNNNLETKITESFNQHSSLVQQKNYEIDRKSTLIDALNGVMMNSAFFFGLLWLMNYSRDKGFLVGTAILLINNMNRIMWPLMSMSQYFPQINSVKKVVEKMDQNLTNKHPYQETIDLKDIKEKIAFKDVSFAYDEHTVVFDEISIDFEMGKKYLIVGPSGRGKSTLLRLLRKYFNPDSGVITIDGMDLKDIKKLSYFQHIANIEQKIFLFEESLKNNITLFKNYSQAEIDKAIRDAGLKEYVNSLEDGLDHIIVDDGKNVSGGQKARIAIARGLISKSKAIFLDEAFASLDDHMARQIERTILDLEDVLVINVSHVIFSDTKHLYDHIYLVNNQEIVEIS